MIKVSAVIEIPMGSKYKYEKSTRLMGDHFLKLDRVLNQKIPANYGFIPFTRGADHDELDIFILSENPIFQLTECEVEIVGGFKCLDDGIEDDKYIGILYDEFWHITDEETWVSDIKKYLMTYKEKFEVVGEMTNEEIKEKLK